MKMLELTPNGTLRKRTVFLPGEGSDGMPAGEPRAQVCATNAAFGDRDSHVLYIAASEHVYCIPMNVAGAHPAAARR